MMSAASVYQQAVDISTDYLGPAGERFMRRQIMTHLGKKPENLTKKDIHELVNWIQLTVALLTSDKKIIDSFSERLIALGGTGKPRPKDTLRAA
ncbi:MAG TPA: hypothetical protein VGO07_06480 [Candidatus Saccharimonadales bacterium]|nr:hypothetical protein [Candidatus Saccharimonadales bacterium]